ncbi:protein-L-isoaspartate O-methyltransferase family protein [Rubritepida flocculans]|uniref:protein-L-isoaspartate O-methyltransferase family protein n=1 Tax=Rubritepida flocculans TaxID=182403 RepID=UPI000405A633|nr:protein-L-isoaspartate O-methyltransferase [Rubritepida flocculans]
MIAAQSVAAQPMAAEDSETARRMMVDGQVTPTGVSDPLLIAAMRDVPRERFVPPALRHRAYADAPLPLAPGRAMLIPMVQARLIQALAPQPGDRALVLASGAGYAAAILARMGLLVTGVEQEEGLLSLARQGCDLALRENRPEFLPGDPSQGHAPGAPYRVILIEGAVARIPRPVRDQMAEGGRLACLRVKEGRLCEALLLRRAGGGVGETALFETQADPLPGFAPPRGFAF